MRKKISLLLIGLLCMTAVTGCSMSDDASANTEQDHVIRIGYQKNGPLIILKSLGTLEERLDSLGYTVEWKEFQAGPALVEALNAGSIDFGRTGNSPVIFAQAAGTPFVIVAAGKSKFAGSGILVPKDSDIKTVADLKNKTVSFAKGSSSHYLIAKALENSSLQYTDITPAFLTPGDARIAFEQGDVDAMVVWDPYTASTELFSNASLLVNGEGITTDRDFFITNDQFAENHADLIDVVMEEIKNSSDWSNNNHEELVAMLAPILNIEEEAIKKAVERRIYGVDPISEEIIQEQQEIADTFYRLNIIPKKINVADVMQEQSK
ncbi:sulfonate ABC transporter substrate-binding protein [Lentibacillus populi]|uniref:Putative aliphatic sulfonates-binding protein n=1 Tax=Lentibacillus populi TaxID=1827502 RepID=A0A9W5TUJ5_9BACI|nr:MULTISPECIES: aliphatic sulfonate ABC transporter substrate-binding protein [Bacillaceae]MBT2214961.1 aliphatic sulfonate ABC transporter substrate-binding protein [Virgibacillus dakarensis]GGB31447.1 sulfonate ABC transporter substrate-binding protein [Lentibacillus populi]